MLLKARICADGKRHLAVHGPYGSLQQRYRTSQKDLIHSLACNFYLLLAAVRSLSRSSSDPLTLVQLSLFILSANTTLSMYTFTQA